MKNLHLQHFSLQFLENFSLIYSNTVFGGRSNVTQNIDQDNNKGSVE